MFQRFPPKNKFTITGVATSTSVPYDNFILTGARLPNTRTSVIGPCVALLTVSSGLNRFQPFCSVNIMKTQKPFTLSEILELRLHEGIKIPVCLMLSNVLHSYAWSKCYNQLLISQVLRYVYSYRVTPSSTLSLETLLSSYSCLKSRKLKRIAPKAAID